MSVLPWKIKTESTTIADENGNELPGVPKYGSLTLDEIEMVKSWNDESSAQNHIEYAEMAVCQFFRYRLKLDDSITNDEILTGPDGNKIPTSLLVAVFNFFMKEEAGVKDEASDEAEETPKKKQTGRKSSGSSKSTIRAVKSLPPKTSEESQSTLSKEQSKPMKQISSDDSNLPVAL